MSFNRRAETQVVRPPGTRSSRSTSTVSMLSTGIPSLDDVLGGGLPLGSVLVVLTPDPNTAYAELVQRHFVAQGIASGQGVCILDDSAIEFASGCMWMPNTQTTTPGSQEVDETTPDNHGGSGVKIAWRYEHMKKFQTSVDYTESVSFCSPIATTFFHKRSSRSKADAYCLPLDLTCRIPEQVVSAAIASDRLRCLPVLRPVQATAVEAALTQLDNALCEMEQTIRYTILPSSMIIPEIII